MKVMGKLWGDYHKFQYKSGDDTMIQQFSKRQNQIVTYLIAHGKTKCSVLSTAIKVSDKTIRNEIKQINAIIDDSFIVSDNDGFFLDNDKALLLHDLESSTNKNDIFSTILQHLILGNEPTNFDCMADYFNLSSSSLQNKIRIINEYAKDFHVAVVRSHNTLTMKGSDYDKRKLFLSMIYSETDSSFNDILDFQHFFPEIDVEFIRKVVIDAIHHYECTLPKFYETNLFINICAILCIPNTEDLNYHSSIDTQRVESRIAKQIVDKLPIKPNEYMQHLITSTLTGIIKNEDNLHSDHSFMLNEDYDRNIQAIIKEAFEYYSISVDFSSFIHILTTHIYDLIQRVQSNHNCIINTPISIRDSCVFIYEVAVYICNRLNEHYHIEIPESEISLISIHIGFAIETSLNKNKKINLAFYAFHYDVIEKYIIDIINNDFPEQINFIEITDMKDIQYLTNLDIFITTKSMIPFGSYEYCKISPLLTELDKVKIQQSIFNAIDKQKKAEFITLIHRCFDEDLFFYDTSFDKRKNVLQFLTLHLQLKGVVDDSFLDSVFKREELDATSFMNVYALPHSLNFNALKSKIAVFINPNGISWGRQRVNFVFLIALNKEDKSSFQPLFDGFANILADDKKLNELMRITTYDEFILCLEKQ